MKWLRRSDVAILSIAGLAIVFGVILNPFVDTWWEQHQAILLIVAVAVLAAISLEIVRSECPTVARVDGAIARLSPPCNVGFFAVFVAGAWLFREWWTGPKLFADDYQYIAQSIDWRTASRNIFVPFNEHLATITRVVTWALVQIGGEHPERAFAVFSAILFLILAFLHFQLARRIGGGELPALIASAWFVVSASYAEIVTWYSASQWMISTCLLLGSLLVVERPSNFRLVVAATFAAIAPWNYSIGVIVGPLTSLWLWSWHGRRNLWSLIPAAVGIASTVVVLIIVRRSMDASDYWNSGGRGMLESFAPIEGFQFSVRLFVERLLPTDLLFPGSKGGAIRSVVILSVLGIAAVAIIRRTPSVARLWPIAALIVVGYAITIPFRTWQTYLGLLAWNRYQLIPQVGLSLLIAGLLGAVHGFRRTIDWRTLSWFLLSLILWTAVQSGVVLRLYG